MHRPAGSCSNVPAVTAVLGRLTESAVRLQFRYVDGMSDKSLSSHAQNAKMISQNASVILRGSVRSKERKVIVANAVKAFENAERVTAELIVKVEIPSVKDTY